MPQPQPQPQQASASPSRKQPRISLSIGIILTLLVISLIGLGMCFALAFGWFSGYPESTEKSVPIYDQHSGGAPGLSVYLHPPLNSIQAAGESQLLAFQFTNTGKSEMTVNDLNVSSAGCFQIAPATRPDKTKLPTTLAAGESALLWYSLSVAQTSGNCLGQFPLVFRYNWYPGKAVTPAPVGEVQSLSTGPIRVSTASNIHWERFFSLLAKVIPVILLPIVLAAAGWLFQRFQDQKADRQKRQEQKLEVWKTILPGIVKAIRDHYIPILRVISIMKDETSNPPATESERDDIVASALLFRMKMTHLVNQNGGFYFRSNAGEALCADLTNLLLDRLYTLSGDRDTFLRTAEKLTPDSSVVQAKDELHIGSPLPGPFRTMCTHFKEEMVKGDTLTQMTLHLGLLKEVLNHEVNDPFYPFWYEAEPPRLDRKKLEESTDKLGLKQEDAEALKRDLTAYFADLDQREKAAANDQELAKA